MKKTRLHFFSKDLENAWNLRKYDCEIFTEIWAKKIRHNFLSERGLDTPSYTPGFVGDFVHYTPYKGFRSHGLDERQLIEIRVN